MKHQPFEEWLLNEEPNTLEQKRELELHLRSCDYCRALAETGRVLRSVSMASPAEGFTNRFQTRLAEYKIADRRRKLWGAGFFLIGGISLLLWLTGPSILTFLSAPDNWIGTLVEWGIFLFTTFRTLSQAGQVFLRMAPDFLSPFAWMIILSGLAGFSLLWSISIWRFVRAPQGV